MNGYPYSTEGVWNTCAAIGFKAKGAKVGVLSSGASAHECAIACNGDSDCQYWRYDVSKGKCLMYEPKSKASKNAIPVNGEHSDTTFNGRKFLSGTKACAYESYTNLWDEY